MRTFCREQIKDSGLALTLVAMLVFAVTGRRLYFDAALVCLVAVMAVPAIFRPFARVWFGLADILGAVMSKVVMLAIFLLLFAPMGLARRAFGWDPMRTRVWKRGETSVFVSREQVFDAKSLENPF